MFSILGDIMSSSGVFSTLGDTMITLGDIMSTSGMFSTLGDIIFTFGAASLWKPFNFYWKPQIPWCTHEIPHPQCINGIPHMHHDIPRCTHDIPQCIEHPPMYSWYLPNVLMVSPPNVLNTHYTGWKYNRLYKIIW